MEGSSDAAQKNKEAIPQHSKTDDHLCRLTTQLKSMILNKDENQASSYVPPCPDTPPIVPLPQRIYMAPQRSAFNPANAPHVADRLYMPYPYTCVPVTLMQYWAYVSKHNNPRPWRTRPVVSNNWQRNAIYTDSNSLMAVERIPEATFDSKAPEATFDCKAPEATFDSKAPEATFDCKAPEATFDSKSPEATFDSKAPEADKPETSGCKAPDSSSIAASSPTKRKPANNRQKRHTVTKPTQQWRRKAVPTDSDSSTTVESIPEAEKPATCGRKAPAEQVKNRQKRPAGNKPREQWCWREKKSNPKC